MGSTAPLQAIADRPDGRGVDCCRPGGSVLAWDVTAVKGPLEGASRPAGGGEADL